MLMPRPTLFCLLVCLMAPWDYVQPAPLTETEAEAWLDYVVPLPHEVQLTGSLAVPAGSVRVIGPSETTPITQSAVAELERAVGELRGSPRATIRLLLGGSRARPLQDLPASEQSYRITSAAGGRELRVIALEPPGLYYGALTLAQLIAGRATADTIFLPLITVTDWPDMPDRGLWGADSFLEVEWMARRKLNLIEQISALKVTPEGRAIAGLKPGREPMVELAPRLAMRPAPVILHLEQLSGKGIFEAYPQLRAIGGAEGAICYSRPEIVQVLTEWMVALGSLPGVETVDVWMAENLHGKGGCTCERCRQEDRSVLEARVIAAAWEHARQTLPGLRIRVTTSEETYRSNAAVLDELPPGVGLSYYHSLLTYTARHQGIIPPEIARATGERWIGVVPSLVASIGLTQPFTGAQFIHARITEFVDRGVAGLIGYATPRLKYARFNIESAAEWSWNAQGRSPAEFARSWAVREGLARPELFAEWSETLGPVAWDVYGSEWPAGMRRRVSPPLSTLLLQGKLPELGAVLWGIYPAPWGDIKSPEQLAGDLAAAKQAMTLAEALDEPWIIEETRVIRGYIEALAALHALKLLAPKGEVAAGDREKAARQFRRYIAALEQSAQALPAWAQALDPDESERLIAGTVMLLHELIADMRKTADAMEVPLD